MIFEQLVYFFAKYFFQDLQKAHSANSFCSASNWTILCILGGSSGLLVMGDVSCPRMPWFESQLRILDGHDIFSHSLVVRNVLFV